MPFISRDWRSPGEEWVKTEEGWEKKKILEFESSPRSTTSSLDEDEMDKTDSFSRSVAATGDNKENVCCEGQTDVQKQLACSLPQPVPDVNRSAIHRDAMGGYSPPPYCQITVKPSREVGGYTGFSEVIKRLDFKSALHDIRRFNYVCKLLELLINDSLVSLAGTAQRVVFSLLEELAISVSNNKSNLRLLNKLLTTLRIILTEHYCFGHLLGSTPLWEQHQQAIDRVERVNGDIREELDRPDADRFQLAGLPTECLREVVLCLDSHQDLDCSSRAFSPLADIIEESRIWRQLCQYHFSHQQIASAAAATPALATPLVATPALATPLVATPALATPLVATPELATPLVASAAASEVDEDRAAGAQTVVAQQVDWQTLYHRLRRRHGLREEYTETVMLCRTCRCLFWQCFGHPCTTPTAATTVTCTAAAAVVAAVGIPTADPQMSAEERSRQHIPIPPQTFLTFFSL